MELKIKIVDKWDEMEKDSYPTEKKDIAQEIFSLLCEKSLTIAEARDVLSYVANVALEDHVILG